MAIDYVVDTIRWIELIRFPLITAIATVGFPFVALGIPSARSLVGNLFDVTARGAYFLTLGAVSLAWTVFITTWLVFAQAHARYGVCPPSFHLNWEAAAIALLLAAPTIAAAVLHTHRESPPARGLLLPIMGGLITAGVLGKIFEWLNRWLLPGAGYATSGCEPAPMPLNLDSGYTSELARREHLEAALALALALLVYIALGEWKRRSLGRRTVPALAFGELILMLFCWGCTGLSFFLDWLGVPVTLVVLIWIAITAQSSKSDHYYSLLKERVTAPVTPTQVLLNSAFDRIIVVAANGGGIQAAAWTSRVLTGLESCFPGAFSRSVRFISAVSGGSVGAMYFWSAYNDDGLVPRESLSTVVIQATSSSLDDVSWGWLYTDFGRALLPWFLQKQIGRGRALEISWTCRNKSVQGPLSGRIEKVALGRCPAVIFNATLSETGERLLMGPSDLSGEPGMKDSHRARVSFYERYPDLAIVTATRLSATFPYVTPASRAETPPEAGPQPHVVDGGYYDNYGMSTLVEWVDQGLQGCNGAIKQVLILQIRGAPVGSASPKQQGCTKRGWFYQVMAPISTMLAVRTAGQLAHNEVELSLLERAWSDLAIQYQDRVSIESVVFEFAGPDPPLSWHLTELQKTEIERQWSAPNLDACRDKVGAFLRGESNGEVKMV